MAGSVAGPLRWGLLAAGLISHDFATALRTLPRSEHQLVAVAARDLGRAQDFARRHEIPKAYGTYEELMRDPDVDVVYVGAQHPQHSRAVLQSLAAGKPVLCEKPLGVTAAEVREMVAAARARGLFLMEALWTRFFPAVRALRELLSWGDLGELRLVRADFGQALEGAARVTDWAQAGGGLLDLGIYCVQFISLVAGGRRPERVRAVGRLHEKDPGHHVVPHGAGGERPEDRLPAARRARRGEVPLPPFRGHGLRGPARAPVSAAGPEGEPRDSPGRERAPGRHPGGDQEADWAQVPPGRPLGFHPGSSSLPASESRFCPSLYVL
ncbi:trans-1,2-dihydrobenzene-1,2-diol dehydrogenase isoform X2 [Macrotis lagotis]|uniref:trans-1,2-dihydrobenzene-1,2-diol dehydrogenase isoform X2 n=1 Tax=Macrotis lagotis TaxID=92651 RepID=UPI003D690212